MAAHYSVLAWKFHGPEAYSPWGSKELDTTERTHGAAGSEGLSDLPSSRARVEPSLVASTAVILSVQSFPFWG